MTLARSETAPPYVLVVNCHMDNRLNQLQTKYICLTLVNELFRLFSNVTVGVVGESAMVVGSQFSCVEQISCAWDGNDFLLIALASYVQDLPQQLQSW